MIHNDVQFKITFRNSVKLHQISSDFKVIVGWNENSQKFFEKILRKWVVKTRFFDVRCRELYESLHLLIATKIKVA